MDSQEILALLAVIGFVVLLVAVIAFIGIRAARKAKAEGRPLGKWDGTHTDYHYTDHS